MTGRALLDPAAQRTRLDAAARRTRLDAAARRTRLDAAPRLRLGVLVRLASRRALKRAVVQI